MRGEGTLCSVTQWRNRRMRSLTEVRERQTGERNLTRLRESKSLDEYDRQREENRSDREETRNRDGEGELDRGAEGRGERRNV